MRPLTGQVLAQIYAPTPLNTCALYADYLAAGCHRCLIDTANRRAALIGQMGIECQRRTRMGENLNYRTPARLDAMFSAVHGERDAAELIRRGPEAIANRVYAKRLGNGDEASGDGWRHRGAGGIQCTGKANQEAFGRWSAKPLDQVPGYLRTPEGAMMSAVWFWSTHGLNRWADDWDIDGITRIVNGKAMEAAEDRRLLSDLARVALS